MWSDVPSTSPVSPVVLHPHSVIFSVLVGCPADINASTTAENSPQSVTLERENYALITLCNHIMNMRSVIYLLEEKRKEHKIIYFSPVKYLSWIKRNVSIQQTDQSK